MNEPEELSVFFAAHTRKSSQNQKHYPKKNASSTNRLKGKQKIVTPKELKTRSTFFKPLELTNTMPTKNEKQAVDDFLVELH